ncbi:MAG: Crp/Fnr family transcriptional regulator [Acidobacteria bacterium]|nr:MAG: Crp/Fnr family transcriptional regulator [Acidobacteriota bacterium]
MKETSEPATGLPMGKLRKPGPPVALTALKAIQAPRVYPRGFEFFLEGQSPLGIYVLYTGRVDLSVTDAHGRPMAIGTALPGDILGLSAALSGKYYEETAVAATTCQTGFVRCQDFLRFLSHHPDAAFWVVQLLSDRVTSTLDQLSCINCLPSRNVRPQ